MQRIFPEDIELINKRLVERRNGILLSKKKIYDEQTIKKCFVCLSKEKVTKCKLCNKYTCLNCKYKNVCSICETNVKFRTKYCSQIFNYLFCSLQKSIKSSI